MAAAYTIMISEEQRAALLDLLNANSKVDDEGLPLEFWIGMLTELPAVEAKHPRVLHGFCL